MLPMPKELRIKDGEFKLCPNTEIILHSSCTSVGLEAVKLLIEDIEKVIGFKLQVNKTFEKVLSNSIYIKKLPMEKEAYTPTITPEKIEILGGEAGVFYGIQTLRQIIKTSGRRLKALEIVDEPDFQVRGFYHDVTRGKVPTLKTLKELADRAAFYKINQLQLYVEHTFAFKNHSEVWTGVDPLTAEEIIEFDEYCKRRHIELVPSLATFGHLYMVLTSHSFNELCEIEDSLDKPYSWIDRMDHHTLDVSNRGSIKFVENMLQEFVPLFSSNKFNICCDETFDLGSDKNKELAYKVGKGQLYVDFLNKIISAVKKYDKEVLFWGDIILSYPELLKEIPEDVVCLNWNYSPKADDYKTRIIAESGRQQYVCPGVWGWNKLLNDMNTSFENIRRIISYGKKYNALRVLNTDWGDYGHINFLSGSIPGMIYGAALSWNSSCEEDFSEIDKMISQIEYGDGSQKLVTLIRELSEKQVVTFLEIVWWKEEKFKETDLFIKEPRYKERLFKANEEELHAGYHGALEIKDKLLDLYGEVDKDKSLDFQEFYIAAEGIALFNSLYLVIRKYDLNTEVNKLIHNPKELAVKLEYWLSDFSRVWRRRNKESELYRIKDTFIVICRWLRSI